MRHNAQSENEELAEVEEELATPDKKPKPSRLPGLPPAFMKSLTMTALAEWGDRSQIATIALAASKDIYGVILGGVLGHAICTGLAVVGGRLLASKISEKAVALTGGVLFVSFAMITAGGYVE
ncbi:Gdt1 [Gracilaria domingensis]|nr:Gdt1 [Gracilaria domingensis]